MLKSREAAHIPAFLLKFNTHGCTNPRSGMQHAFCFLLLLRPQVFPLPGKDTSQTFPKLRQEQFLFAHGFLFVNDLSLLVFQPSEMADKTKCSNKQAVMCQEKVEFCPDLSFLEVS